MNLSRSKLYTIVSIACLAGYIWVFYNINLPGKMANKFGGCLIKEITNIPCPSCGTTRSLLLLWKGEFLPAMLINPFGLLMGAMMFWTPIWLAFDVLTKKNTFFVFFQRVEQFFKTRKIAILAIALVLLNWFWNINKQL
jgi:hypothetical protein